MSSLSWPAMPEPWATAMLQVVGWILAELPARAVLVGGSVVRGQPDPRSDLDIQVIIHEPWGQKITRVDAGVASELFIHPLAHVADWFARDAAEGCPVGAHLLATGHPVFDPEGLYPALQAEARRWLAKGPNLDPAALERRRFAPVSDIEDALDVVARDPEQALISVAEALPLIIDVGFLRRGLYPPRRKDRLAAVAALDAEAAGWLRSALGQGDPVARVEAARRLCARMLDATEAFAWASPRSPIGAAMHDPCASRNLPHVPDQDAIPS